MTQPIPTIVIIDPYAAKPETDAINTIQRVIYRTAQQMGRSFVTQVVTPAHPQKQTFRSLHELQPVAIVSLGSLANVTENLDWFGTFEDLINRWVLSERLPCIGVCFTHQYVARMMGARVDFLKRKHEVIYSKHEGTRVFDIIHPKLKLYFSTVKNEDLGTRNKIDLDFVEALRYARTLGHAGWQVIQSAPAQHLHPQEARLRQFLEDHCPSQANFAVLHEQEVYDLPPTLVHAATSQVCQYEAFVSEDQEFFTFQAHPEYDVRLPDGKRFIRNFIYSLCI